MGLKISWFWSQSAGTDNFHHLRYNWSMTAAFALTPAAATTAPGRMRPLNILCDLPSVADLIELCFSNTLNPDDRDYIDQMRRSGRDSGLLPLSGFVWEDNGRIVGNVSLFPFSRSGRKIFLIANVATHPNYRRQGIARVLTQAALQWAREKHAHTIWLHVRQDNPGAIALYRELGFYERTRRTKWYASPDNMLLASSQAASISIRPRSSWDWPQQNRWLEVCYPSNLDWYFTYRWNILRPGVFNGLYRLLADIDTLQWAAYKDNRLGAVLSCQRSARRGDYLWLAAPRRADPEVITTLLLYGRRALAERCNLSLEFPAGIADDAIRQAGFQPERTLIWMEAHGV